jgi:hypothetical protein
MAMYLCCADGNQETAATWALASDGTGAQLTTLTTTTNAGVTYVYSSTFTGTNSHVIDGVAIFCRKTSASPTGTFSVALSEDNGVTATRSVTVNVSDLPLEESWVFFKFGSTLTLDGGTDYRVGVVTSSLGQVAVGRDATAANWGRLLRRTTTGGAGTGDTMLICGEWTGAGAMTARTVTMNRTSTGSIGTATATATAPTQTSTQAFTGMQIGQGGTLTFATTAASNFLLRLSGNLVVWSGGTFNMGTTATPCPRDSTMTLEFNCAADGDYGFLAMQGSTVSIQGQSRTSGKDIWWTLLNTDEAAGQTVLGVADDTGWLLGDRIGVASTTRTRTECETRDLAANAGASSVTVSVALTNAHSGTSPTQAEVILLTRNVKVQSVSATAMTYCFFGTTATVDIDWCEFRYVGNNTTNKRGVNITTTTGSLDMRYCSISDAESSAIYCEGSTGNNYAIRYNACYNVATASGAGIQNAASTSGTAWVISDNIVMLTAAGNAYTLTDVGGTFQNNRAIGASSSGVSLSEAAAIGTISGLVAHSCTGAGISAANAGIRGTMSSLTSWRNSATGIDLSASRANLTIAGATLFGNTLTNITAVAGDVTITDLVSNGDTSFATATGLQFGNNSGAICTIINADFSTVSGIKTAHTSDIVVANAETVCSAVFHNSKFGAATEVATQSNLTDNSIIGSMKHDQTVGNHKTYKRTGTISTDTTIYNTASPSERLTPNNATDKLKSGSRLVAVDSGSTKTISVYVRKSVVGDGAAYNGNQPRLMVKRNDVIGITSDTVLDTMTSAAGSWEQLTATTASATADGAFEVFVDCDGTAGWVNVDDWSVS